jgi:hypothetical protein
MPRLDRVSDRALLAEERSSDESGSRADLVVARSKDARCEDEIASGGGIVRAGLAAGGCGMPESLGLSRVQLEREARWMLRRLPDNPEELPAALADVVISLIEKNNAAIASDLARHQEPPDLPEGL